MMLTGFINTVRKYYQAVMNGFLAILTILGFIISLISITKRDELEWWIVISIVLLNSILIFAVGAFTVITFYKQRKHVTDIEEDYRQKLHEIEGERKSLAEALEQNNMKFDSTVDRMNSFNKMFVSTVRNNISTLNKFLTRIYSVNDKYLHSIDSAKRLVSSLVTNRENCSANYSEEYITDTYKSLVNQAITEYSSNIIDEYKRFLSIILRYNASMIEEYLRSRGINNKVTLTVKQSTRIIHGKDDRSNVHIYTAFRDFSTYDDNKREVNSEIYEINLNTKYELCMLNDKYINNHLDKTASNYRNQNLSFPDFYDCVAAVPILCQYEGNKTIFGFLCCDTKKEGCDCEIFDDTVEKLLFACGLILGTYFDNISYTTDHILNNNEKGTDFLEFIFINIFKDRGKIEQVLSGKNKKNSKVTDIRNKP